MSNFFSQLSYSYGNEDWITEQQALQIKPSDTVLCITASGDRPLNLLVNDCKEMVSIDANKQQNHLLKLKMAAMQHLSYEEYLAFLGAERSKKRLAALKSFSTNMDEEASQFWAENDRMIAKGVLYQGAVERITRYASRVLRCFRGKKIAKLFKIDDIEEQRRFVKEHWNTRAWKKFVELFCHPRITKLLIDDPGFQEYLGPVQPGVYFYQRMEASLETCLAKQNPIISFILKGKVGKEAFSPYLTQNGTKEIKKRLNRLTIKTQNVIDYLEKTHEPTFDCFSLSDIASYMSKEDFERLLRGIIKTAKPGARFCLRQFLSYLEIPADLQHHFQRDRDLEQRLEKEDKCFVYRFFTGTIMK